jgi:hypothetical protein
MIIIILLIILFFSIIIYINSYNNIYKRYPKIDKYIPIIDLPDYYNNSYYFEKDSLQNNRFNRGNYEPDIKKIEIKHNKNNNFRKIYNRNLTNNTLTNNRNLTHSTLINNRKY